MANDSNNKPNINTRNMVMTNGFARIPSALEVSYWNDGVRLAFSPELPESRRTETRRYDYDNQTITVITRQKCNELAEQYEEILKPAIKRKEQKRISIPIADVNLLSIDTGVTLYQDGNVHPFLELTKNINPETLIGSTSIMYEFNSGEYIIDHDPKTGNFAERIVTENELDLFMKDLSSFREASSKTYIHAARCVDNAFKNSITSSLKKIGERVGADMSFMGSYSRDGMGHGSIFDKSNGGTGDPAPKQQYGALEDLDDLGGLLN